MRNAQELGCAIPERVCVYQANPYMTVVTNIFPTLL